MGLLKIPSSSMPRFWCWISLSRKSQSYLKERRYKALKDKVFYARMDKEILVKVDEEAQMLGNFLEGLMAFYRGNYGLADKLMGEVIEIAKQNNQLQAVDEASEYRFITQLAQNQPEVGRDILKGISLEKRNTGDFQQNIAYMYTQLGEPIRVLEVLNKIKELEGDQLEEADKVNIKRIMLANAYTVRENDEDPKEYLALSPIHFSDKEVQKIMAEDDYLTINEKGKLEEIEPAEPEPDPNILAKEEIPPAPLPEKNPDSSEENTETGNTGTPTQTKLNSPDTPQEQQEEEPKGSYKLLTDLPDYPRMIEVKGGSFRYGRRGV